MNSGQTASIKCTNCNQLVDGFTGLEDDTKPSDGDLSICFYCGTISTYAENVTQLKKITDEELEELKNEQPETYVQLQIIVKRIKEK